MKRQVIAEFAQSGQSLPLVSVILPAKDRRDHVVHAVRSVLAQTYRDWQLIIVDDGSTDDTVEALQPSLQDERIELIRLERSQGAAAAHNMALARAQGDYVAYLDSDNTWVPEFLQVMAAFVKTRNVRFAYAATEVREGKRNGRHGYRALPFNREALLERNYIDCFAVLHERSLVDEVGGFDESLRRNIDWEFFIRVAKVTDLELVPLLQQRTTYGRAEPIGSRSVSRSPIASWF